MKPKRVALLCALVLLCLPAVASADSTDFGFVAAGGDSHFSSCITRRAVGNRAELVVAATAGPSATEQSTGLLLLIGLGLIGGASLIDVKIRRSGSAPEAENAGETAILSRPTWSQREPRAPSSIRISIKVRKSTGAMQPMRIQQVRQASSDYGR
jgi:hypothetical protein